MCFGVLVAFSTTENLGKPCRLALAFVTNIHKVWMEIKLKTKFRPLVQLDASKA